MSYLDDLADTIGVRLRSTGDMWAPSRHADAYVVPDSQVIAVQGVSDLRSDPDAVVYVTFDLPLTEADGRVPAEIVESLELIDTMDDPHAVISPFGGGAEPVSLDELAGLIAAELVDLPRSYEE